MRTILASLAALLLLLPMLPTNGQAVVGPPDIVTVVQHALQELVAATDDSITTVNQQRHVYLEQFTSVGLRVAVTGPISEFFEIANYWMKNLLTFNDLEWERLTNQYASILNSIHDQVQQLTSCWTTDVNSLIASALQAANSQMYVIPLIVPMYDILADGRAFALLYRQLALSDCGGHLEELQRKLIDNLLDTADRIERKYIRQCSVIRCILVRNLNELLDNIRQLASSSTH